MSDILSLDEINIDALCLDDAERPAENAEPRKTAPPEKKGLISRFLARFGKPQEPPKDYLPPLALGAAALPAPLPRRWITSGQRRSSNYAVSASI